MNDITVAVYLVLFASVVGIHFRIHVEDDGFHTSRV